MLKSASGRGWRAHALAWACMVVVNERSTQRGHERLSPQVRTCRDARGSTSFQEATLRANWPWREEDTAAWRGP